MSRRTLQFSIPLLLAATIACSDETPDRLSRAEAEVALEEAIGYAAAGDFESLCMMPNPLSDEPREQCLHEVERGPVDATSLAVEVQGARPLANATGATYSWILELCVPTPAEPLYTEVQVLRQSGVVAIPYPVFWQHRIIVSDPGADGRFTSGAGPTQRDCVLRSGQTSSGPG